jgi:hypothetical protein
LDGGVSGLDPGCNRLAGIRHLWEASTARNLVASTQVLAVLVLRHQRWLRGCLAGNLVTGNPVAGTPRQPDPAPVGLARAQFDPDPAGGAEGCQSISDRRHTATHVRRQRGVGRVAVRLGHGVLEQRGGQDDRGLVALEPGVFPEVVRQGGEGELGLSSRALRERTLPPSGPRVRGRRGETGCGAVHGRAPRSPARIRAWNIGAASARAVRNSARRRARSSGASGP